MIPVEVRKVLEKQQYRIVGNHSSVKICRWTKKSLTEGKVCYKEKWYSPVESHRCMQMTPAMGCNFHCLHCWRLHSGDRPGFIWKEFPLDKKELDEPTEIVEGCIKARKKLLSGFGGNPKVDKKKFEEALKPTMMTLSLTGEPTLYPEISELVIEAKKRGMISFLVTNGSKPKILEKMDPLPWQLYVSIYGPDKKTYKKITRPKIKNAWKKMNETLDLFPSLNTRKVLRLTMIKGYNMKNPKGYAKLIEKSEPNFVEVKAYEWVGESQKRLPMDAMPYHEDVKRFAEQISEHSSFKIKDEFKPSRVVLLTK